MPPALMVLAVRVWLIFTLTPNSLGIYTNFPFSINPHQVFFECKYAFKANVVELDVGYET